MRHKPIASLQDAITINDAHCKPHDSSDNVIVAGHGVLRNRDMGGNGAGTIWLAASGAPTVLANNRRVLRSGDAVASTHGEATIVPEDRRVLVGDAHAAKISSELCKIRVVVHLNSLPLKDMKVSTSQGQVGITNTDGFVEIREIRPGSIVVYLQDDPAWRFSIFPGELHCLKAVVLLRLPGCSF